MKKSTVFRLSILSALLGTLAACGGGGGSSSSSTASGSATTLSGKVIDGYIIGAKVCLDVNSNNKCDAGEPTTTSIAGGAYTLPPYTGSIAGLRVIAEVGPDAIDMDDNKPIGAGNGYSLLAPAAASLTVTPLSTLVSSTIQAGGGESQVSIGEAISNVSAKFGLPPASLLANDYKESATAANVATAAVAKAAATAMSQVTNNLRNNPEIQAAGLTDGQIIQAAALSVKNNVLPQIVSAGQLTATAAASSTAIVDAVTTAVSTAGLGASSTTTANSGVSLSGNVQNIIVATKSGDASVVQIKDVLDSGFVIAQEQSGDYYDSTGKRVTGNYSGYRNELVAEYLKTADGKFPPYQQRVHINGKWFDTYEGGSDWTYNGKGWENIPGQGINVPDVLQPTYAENCVLIPDNSARTVISRYCATQKNVSNRTIAELIPGICDDVSSAACKSAKFPDGSFVYDLSQSVQSTLTDKYPGRFRLWTSDDGWKGYCTTSNAQDCQRDGATIFDFIDWTRASNRNHQFIGNNCNTAFRIASYDSAGRKGTVSWSTNNGDCERQDDNSIAKVLETTNFEIITAGGKDVFIVPTPATYYANNPSSDEPFRIFATQKNRDGFTGVWSGAYYPTDFKNTMAFTGDIGISSQFMNRITFDAILNLVGYAPYPYEGSSSSGPYTRP
jgi:hypothetical protein